ncbi:MAG: YvcK family protein [Candidatus Poribacteria bacterium]|nr:YvcK family protein [Candidatus Poribacteria bacterium]
MSSLPSHHASQDVVCIGGGTGLSTLLHGIKQYASVNRDTCPFNIDRLTAIVAVSDDGGSSGRLIDEFGVLPPGDIRNCLVALADERELVSQLFSYRFHTNGSLHGHSIGNLLLVALSDLFGTFPKAVHEAARVLAVRGNILPVTAEPIMLCAELEDGDVVCGESEIPKRVNRSPIRRVFLARRGNDNVPQPDDSIRALPEVIKAIEKADVIFVGPGSLFTSILPNFVVPGVAEALERSEAIKIYISNVMVEPGETDDFTVSDHIRAIRCHARVDFDYVLVNNRTASRELLSQYGLVLSRFGREIPRRNVQVMYDPRVDSLAPEQILATDLISEVDVHDHNGTRRAIRHDPEKTVRALVKLLTRRDERSVSAREDQWQLVNNLRTPVISSASATD